MFSHTETVDNRLKALTSESLRVFSYIDGKIFSVFLLTWSESLDVQMSIRLSVNFSHFRISSRTIGPIPTKLEKMRRWSKGIQVSSNERPRPFPGAGDSEF